jgi:hypothetical protein
MLARVWFPQFKNQVTNEHYTLGKRFYMEERLGMPVRVPNQKDGSNEVQANRVILVFGDSISGGHGLAYEDIYWTRWQRLLEFEYKDPPEVIAVVAPGNNFVDNLAQMKTAVTRFKAAQIDVVGIIYQFNFNDITPYSKQDLLNLEHIDPAQRQWWKALVRFRLEYLNESVLQRVVSHYIARLFRANTEDCDKRGLSALGSGTWSYGARPFQNQAKQLWSDFEKEVFDVKRVSGSIPFFILISPLLYDIDHENVHDETFSKTNLAWNCQTIDPRRELKRIADAAHVELVDPTQYIRRRFLARIEEGNPERFFFVSDDNHFNHLASMYFAEVSYYSVIKKILGRTIKEQYNTN